MSIYDRARDALNKATPGPWEWSTSFGGSDFTATEIGPISVEPDWEEMYSERPGDIELAALAPELAAEVVRLHDQLAEFADRQEEIGRSALSGNLTDQAYGTGALHMIMFLRKILEGVEK